MMRPLRFMQYRLDLWLDLDPYGGTDPLGMFPLFLREPWIIINIVIIIIFISPLPQGVDALFSA